MKLGLKLKMVVLLLAVGILPMVFVGVYSIYKSSSMLHDQAQIKLNADLEMKKNDVKSYFDSLKNQILTFSNDTMILEAMDDLKNAFYGVSHESALSKEEIDTLRLKLGEYYEKEFAIKYQKENDEKIEVGEFLKMLSSDEVILQYRYIKENSNPLGSKDNLDFANDPSTYTKLHKKYHPHIRSVVKKFSINDFFLVDIKTGNVVYAYSKQIDFATSLFTGPYKDSNLAEVFKKALDIKDKESVAVVDYKKYIPSYNAPASFIATPIWNGEEKIGVLIYQIPIDQVNLIMGNRQGQGKSEESIIVGSDHLLRSDSFIDPTHRSVVSSFKKPDLGKVEIVVVDKAIKGESGLSIIPDYMGVESIISYAPLDFFGVTNWAVISKISTEEAFFSSNQLRMVMTIIFLATALFIAFFASFIGSWLTKQIEKVAMKLFQGVEEVAKTSDDIAHSSNELSRATTEQAAGLQETVSSVDEISSMVQRNADAANNSTQVSEKSTQIAIKGKETVVKMIDSISEISKSNDEIMQEMQKNNQEISQIVTLISEIGNKTKVINDIVFQTKLLSFNASVEAARAGEHGKGFAVVAEEVGNLATMSGKAALEITNMLADSIDKVKSIVDKSKISIEAIVKKGKEKVEEGKKTAGDCGEVLEEILGNVKSVDEMIREIASASSEQSTGVSEITKAMQQLDKTTHQNTSVAQKSAAVAKELKNEAQNLNSTVSELMFLVDGVTVNDEKKITYTKEKDLSENSRDEGKREKNHSPKDNVLPLKRNFNKNPVSVEKKTELKVSGLDTSVPSEDDPRFEDL